MIRRAPHGAYRLNVRTRAERQRCFRVQREHASVSPQRLLLVGEVDQPHPRDDRVERSLIDLQVLAVHDSRDDIDCAGTPRLDLGVLEPLGV